MNNELKQKLLAALKLMDAMVEMIGAHKDGMPSGHLYAQVMGSMSLDMYERVIDFLVQAKRVRRGPNHLLFSCDGS